MELTFLQLDKQIFRAKTSEDLANMIFVLFQCVGIDHDIIKVCCSEAVEEGAKSVID